MSVADHRTERAAWIATAGVAAIPILVPLLERRVSLGPVPLDAVILSLVIALSAALPYVRARGAGALPATGVAIPVAVFLGVAAIGTAYHGSPATVMTWFRYASYFALIPVVGLIAENPARRRVLLWALVVGGAATLLHATYQYMNPGLVQAMGMTGLSEAVSTRVYSTFENPNFYAEYLVLLFSGCLALTLTEKKLLRLVAAGLTMFSGVVLLLTYTRGSWVALAVGVAITVTIVNWRLLMPLGLAAGVAIIVLPGVGSRLLSVVSTGGTAGFRMRLWRIAGEVIANHPFLGVGLGDFYRGFQEVALAQPGLGVGYAFYGAHNSYFQVAAETGVLGGLAFAIAVLALCRAGLAYGLARYEHERDRLQAAALLAGIIAFAFNALTSNAFQHPRGAVFFFLVAGLSAGIGANARQRSERAPTTASLASALPPLIARSVLGRTAIATVRVTASSAAWRWLTRLPAPGGILGTSRAVRAVLGTGSPGPTQGRA